jgi:hypothetical protein
MKFSFYVHDERSTLQEIFHRKKMRIKLEFQKESAINNCGSEWEIPDACDES